MHGDASPRAVDLAESDRIELQEQLARSFAPDVFAAGEPAPTMLGAAGDDRKSVLGSLRSAAAWQQSPIAVLAVTTASPNTKLNPLAISCLALLPTFWTLLGAFLTFKVYP